MKRYKSKVDWWFYLAVAGSAIFLAVVIPPKIVAETMSIIGAIVLAVAIAGFPAWLMISTHYDVAEDELRIRSGPFRWTIKLSDIQSVTPTKSLISSTALSMNRLEICYEENRKVLVSPLDKEGFTASVTGSLVFWKGSYQHRHEVLLRLLQRLSYVDCGIWHACFCKPFFPDNTAITTTTGPAGGIQTVAGNG